MLETFHPPTPSPPAQGLRDMCTRRGLLALAALATLVTSAHAATVELAETSNPAGILSKTSYIESATLATTSTAATTSGDQHFTHWTINGIRAEDFLGRAINPSSFLIYEQTAAIAHYLAETQDSDTDDIPDWYEIEFYANLTQLATSDTDADGFNLAIEKSRSYHPKLHDNITEGGLSRRGSDTILVVFPSTSIRIQELSDPAGIVSGDHIVDQDVEVTLSTPPPTSSGLAFTGWFIDGTRIDSPLDSQPISISRGVDTTVVAKYLNETTDSDADGIPDWQEMFYFNTLDHDGSSDTDSDGYTATTEFLRYYNPLLKDNIAEGGVSRRPSDLIEVNLAGFHNLTLTSSPAGFISDTISVAEGTTASSPDLTGNSTNAYRFTHWTLDDVRQVDPQGTSAGSFSVLMNAVHNGIAHYLPETQDSDNDAIFDWQEVYYYGNLDSDSESDSDGDGYSLNNELLRNYHPHLTDHISEGGISRRSTNLIAVNMQLFERLRYVLKDSDLTEIFTTNLNQPTGRAWSGATAPAIGDWDGDGDSDFFIASPHGITVFENQGNPITPNFHEHSTGFATLASDITTRSAIRMAAGDWNSDGNADLAVGANDGEIHFFLSTGNFSGVNASTFSLTVTTGSVVPALCEVTGDDRVDLLVLMPDGSVRLYENQNGAQPFDDTHFTDNWLGHQIPNGTGLAIVDFTGDDQLDVLASDQNGRIYEFHGQPDGIFFKKSAVWGGSGRGFASGLTIAVLDFDNDQDIDLVGGTDGGVILGLRDPRIGAPSGLLASVGANNVMLSWSPNPQSRVSGYHAYRTLDPTGDWDRLTTDPNPSNHYIDPWNNQATVCYRVTAVSETFLPGNSKPRLWESEPSEKVQVEGATVTLTVGGAKARSGQIARLLISIENSFGLSGSGLDLHVTYDPTKLIPMEQEGQNQPTVKTTGLSKDLTLADNAATANGELIITGSGGELNAGSGKLFTLNFVVAAGLPDKSRVAVTLSSATLRDTAANAVNVVRINGALEISETYGPGDINGDGLLSDTDKLALQNLLKANAPTPTENELQAGDLNGDGKLSIQDLQQLIQLLNTTP